MLPDDTRNKIENITSGANIEGKTDHCTTIRNFLCSRFGASTTIKKEFESRAIAKEKQAKLIEEYCDSCDFWFKDHLGEERYLTRGGEAKVYLHPDNLHVVKFNDAIYYATWLEFFNSILLHNLIFENTSYRLIGFARDSGTLVAMLQQPFILSDNQAQIEDIKGFLEFNGFENTMRNDYLHRNLGLILEDMHDENVILNRDTLFFIDSVFYVVKSPIAV